MGAESPEKGSSEATELETEMGAGASGLELMSSARSFAAGSCSEARGGGTRAGAGAGALTGTVWGVCQPEVGAMGFDRAGEAVGALKDTFLGGMATQEAKDLCRWRGWSAEGAARAWETGHR